MAVTKFNIRTRRSKHFFKVFVFDTKDEMIKFYKHYPGSNGDNGGWSARCIGYERIIIKPGEPEKKANDIGWLLFYKEQTGSGISSHEIFHATLHYMRVVNRNGTDEILLCEKEVEEQAALINGDLNRSFTTQCYKYGIYK